MAHLLLDHPDYEPLRWAIDERLLLIGRGTEADIRIPDRSISRIHARLEPTPDGLKLEDLGSANGTFVNDVRIDGPAFISVGDTLMIGSVGMRVVAGDPPRPTTRRDTPASDDATVVRDAPSSSPSEAPTRRGVATPIIATLLVVAAVIVWATRPKTTLSPTTPSESLGGAVAASPSTDPPKSSTSRAATPIATDAIAETPITDAMPSPSNPEREMSTPIDIAKSDSGTEMTEAARRALEELERPTPPAAEATPTVTPQNPALEKPISATPPTPVAPVVDADAAARLLAGATPPTPTEAPTAVPTTVRLRGVDMPLATAIDRGLADERGHLLPTDDDRFLIRRLHLDLLCRTPSEDEYRRCAALGDAELVDRVMANPERWGTWYEDELYFMLLLDDFRPPEDRMRDLPGRLSANAATWKDALTEIVKSQYFNARNPGNDTYVTVVFEQMLGITVQKEPQLLEAGKKMYDGYASAVFGKRGKSQGDLVDIAVAHPAFTSTYLARLLKRLLGETPPKTILDPLAKRLAADPSAHDAILRELLLSPAYGKTRAAARRKSDPQFIRGLWQDLFGRVPTYQELRNVRNATQALADPTGIRSVIVRTLLDGGKAGLPEKSEVRPDVWIPDQFRRFLGRKPSQEELAAFSAAWAKDACKPGTILHALLTGTDYDHY